MKCCPLSPSISNFMTGNRPNCQFGCHSVMNYCTALSGLCSGTFGIIAFPRTSYLCCECLLQLATGQTGGQTATLCKFTILKLPRYQTSSSSYLQSGCYGEFLCSRLLFFIVTIVTLRISKKHDTYFCLVIRAVV